jgi:hypothetical protein
MTTFPQNLVLSEEHSLDTAHETPPFTVQVAVHLLLKGRLVKISRADCDAESNGFFGGFAADVLEDGKGRVDAAAFFKEGADCATGALRGDEDDVDVRWGDNTGEVLVDDGESVGEVESLIIRAGDKDGREPCPWSREASRFPTFLFERRPAVRKSIPLWAIQKGDS